MMRFLRLRAWRFPLFHRMIWLLSPLLYFVSSRDLFSSFLSTFFLLLPFLFLYGAFSVLINDYFDFPFDLAAGKEVEPLSRTEILFLSSLTLSACLGLSFLLSPSLSFLPLLGLILAFLYSVKGIRLKERGWMGVGTDVGIEFLPLLFSILLLRLPRWDPDVFLFLLLYLSVQLTSQVEHQLKDLERDRRVGLKTLVTERGEEFGLRLLRLLSSLSFLLLFPLLFWFSSLPWFSPLFLSFLLFSLFHPKWNPEFPQAHRVSPLFADVFYLFLFQIFPLYLSLLMVWTHPFLLPLLPPILLLDCRFLFLSWRWIRRWV